MPQDHMQRLLDIMRTLRDPQQGCPWDQQQTYKTIVPHTIEEAYEVADAIERDEYDELRDELGDLLFQVVFYAQLAQEEQRFEFNDIVEGICTKLERRHPHVFGDVTVEDAEQQTRHWEELKAEERKSKSKASQVHSALDGVTHRLPAMSVAEKLQRRAAQVGFDWPDEQGVMAKVEEGLAEVRQDWPDAEARASEIGDLLFTCVNLARHAGVDAETALRQANRKFEQRFRSMEQQFVQQGTAIAQADSEQMEAAWERVKTSSLP